MQFKDGQPIRTSSPEMCTRSSDTSIDEQTAATLPHFSQILKEDRYAIYVSLTFTFAVMWSNKSSPTSGPVYDTCSSLGSAGGPQIVSAGSSSNDKNEWHQQSLQLDKVQSPGGGPGEGGECRPVHLKQL